MPFVDQRNVPPDQQLLMSQAQQDASAPEAVGAPQNPFVPQQQMGSTENAIFSIFQGIAPPGFGNMPGLRAEDPNTKLLLAGVLASMFTPQNLAKGAGKIAGGPLKKILQQMLENSPSQIAKETDELSNLIKIDKLENAPKALARSPKKIRLQRQTSSIGSTVDASLTASRLNNPAVSSLPSPTFDIIDDTGEIFGTVEIRSRNISDSLQKFGGQVKKRNVELDFFKRSQTNLTLDELKPIIKQIANIDNTGAVDDIVFTAFPRSSSFLADKANSTRFIEVIDAEAIKKIFPTAKIDDVGGSFFEVSIPALSFKNIR